MLHKSTYTFTSHQCLFIISLRLKPSIIRLSLFALTLFSIGIAVALFPMSTIQMQLSGNDSIRAGKMHAFSNKFEQMHEMVATVSPYKADIMAQEFLHLKDPKRQIPRLRYCCYVRH